MANAQLNATLTANTSEMVSQLNQVNASLAQMAANSARVNQSARVSQPTLSTWDKLKQKIMENVKSLTSLNGIFQTVIGIQAVSAIGNVIKRTEALNNQFIALQQHSSFRGIAKDFENLGEITLGLADKMQMLPSISKATAFGIDLSNGKLEKFTQLAQKLGIMMGKDVITSFDDLTVSVGRQSVLIADNLGIMIKKGEANAKWAKENGVAVKDMTAMNKQQAFLNELLLKGAEITENIDMSKMTMAGSAAINTLELSMEKFKKTMSTVMVDTGEGLGRFMFDAKNLFTFNWEQSKSLRRAEEREEIEALAKKTKGDALYIAKSTERYKKYYEDQSRFGISSAEITERYYQRFLINAKGMSEDAIDMMQFMLKRQIAGVDLFVTEMENRIAKSKSMLEGLSNFSENKTIEKSADKQTKKDEAEAKRKLEAQKRAAEKQAALMEEYFGDGGLLDQIQTKQRNQDIKDVEDQKALEYKQLIEWQELQKSAIIDMYTWQNDLDKQQREHQDKLNKQQIKSKEMTEKSEKAKNKKRMEEAGIAEYKFSKNMGDLKKQGIQEVANFSAMMINDVLLGEKEFHKEMIGDFAKMIGSQLISKGTFNVLEGLIATAMGMPWGTTQLTVGGAEIAAGIGMSGVGKAIGTTGGSSSEAKTKETAAMDRTNTKPQNQKTDVYLYPNEKPWLRRLNKSIKKIGSK